MVQFPLFLIVRKLWKRCRPDYIDKPQVEHALLAVFVMGNNVQIERMQVVFCKIIMYDNTILMGKGVLV